MSSQELHDSSVIVAPSAANIEHTPGPWRVAYLDKNDQPVVSAEHTEIATCWHHCVGSLEVQTHGNARLIAAAPELLEALTKWTIAHRVFTSDKDIARECYEAAMAAIAKATAQ